MKKEKQTEEVKIEEDVVDPIPDEKTAQLEKEIAGLNDKLLRTLAEYDNFRKRSTKEKENIYPEATSTAVAAFLPVIDNFERALGIECSDAEFKKGIDMILASFKNALGKLDVEVFGSAGDVFSPDMHNAVMHIEDENYKEQEIVEVMQKGYKIKDKVIRYAMVKVAN